MNLNERWLTLRQAMTICGLLIIGQGAGLVAALADEQPDEPPTASAAKSQADPADDQSQPEAVEPADARKWITSLAAGYTAAQRDRKPILVRAVGRSCPHCKRLVAEMLDPKVQEELSRWTLVEVDVDASPDDARLLRVGPIPALRLLTPRGKVVVGSDGAADAADVLRWLEKNYDKAAAVPAKELIAEGTPSMLEVIRVVRQFQQRDATLREAAVRRLLPYPQVAAVPIIGAFSEGTLATRLASLELLREWKAPVDGLDPWQPKTLTDQRIKALADWSLSDKLQALGTDSTRNLTDDELKQAVDEIAKMVIAEPSTALAIRERLARHSSMLLPEVYRQLEQAKTDQARQRLTSLRYRLAATDRLVLDWPGGLERLAGGNEEARHRAADELARRAVAADEPLLLELFSDPAPLVREISLQALQKVGGASADGALIRLLKDPEPNVRAAVLKQLTESPSDAVVLKVAKYITSEKDADLVVHGVRVLRQGSPGLTLAALTKLLKHESWRVRAEAAEAVAKSIGRSSSLGQSAKADTYAELVELLKDEDGFVVSKAVAALAGADLVTAVKPLIEAAERHPELAATVVTAMSQGSKQGQAAIPHLRKFATHEIAQVRAAAITGLSSLIGSSSQKQIRAGLEDKESVVRIAAARGLLLTLSQRKRGVEIGNGEPYVEDKAAEPKSGILSRLFDALKGKPKEKTPPDVPLEKDKSDEPKQDSQPEPAVPKDNQESDPDDSEEEASGKLQRKLLQIRAGKTFRKWQYETAPALVLMLAADDIQERLAAALALAALGRDQSAIPALTQLLEAHPELATQLSAALEWLLWDDRARLFNLIVEMTGDVESIGQVTTVLAYTGDAKSAQLMWPLLALDRKGADRRLAPVIQQSLMRAYFQDKYYRPESAKRSLRNSVAAELVEMTENGSQWQQLTALSILLRLDAERADKAAAKLYETADTNELKGDLFRIRLLSLPEADSVALAMSVLVSDQPVAAELSLSLLTQGTASIASMKSIPIELYAEGNKTGSARSYGGSRPILPEAPAGLMKEGIVPLLDSDDPAVAAQAGYLLVLLDEPSGLEPLLKYWQNQKKPSREWDRLVYRAIVYVDDADELEALRQIYKRMDKKDIYNSGIREFYWTIRSMTGRPILKFRGQIRDEIGIDNLR